MIQTSIVPTTRLGAGARLLLHIKRSPMAFSEAQLTQAVIGFTKDQESLIASHGMPRQHGSTVYYLRPETEDDAELAAFDAALEWLLYMSRAVQHADGRVLLTGSPL